ncbi:site-specific integrase [Periweissella cryptocerci]|uniref:Site-specific integrase n=1 Tax=Periweissella cryptocerci TaxID=2506420 RepID=A0A4P6YRX9_9LACO|nr:site-specific integrase [Periweissella cryptocerci]QBO35428.1 site-specific integrase [Periweissella cryptocerci]
MASIKKRGKTWYAKVSVTKAGKRTQLTKGGFIKKSDAQLWADQLEVKKGIGVNVIGSTMLYSDYFDKWWKNYRKDNIRKSTQQSYVIATKHVQRLFPDVMLKDVTKTMLQNGLDSFAESHTKAYVSQFKSYLISSLKDALVDELITKDVTQRLVAHGKASKSAELKYLEADEFERLQDYLYDHTPDMFHAFLLVGLETGMRKGEMAALTWNDLNLMFKSISITKSYSQISDEITEPKTKASIRHIGISQSLSDYLREYKKTAPSSEYLFTKPDGHQMINQQNVNSRLKTLTRQLGIKRISIHGLRHSHVSYLLYKGLSMEYVSKRLGHADSTVTREVYAHFLKAQETSEQTIALEVLEHREQKGPKGTKTG